MCGGTPDLLMRLDTSLTQEPRNALTITLPRRASGATSSSDLETYPEVRSQIGHRYRAVVGLMDTAM